MNERKPQLIIFISLLNLIISNLGFNQTINTNDFLNKTSISIKVNKKQKFLISQMHSMKILKQIWI